MKIEQILILHLYDKKQITLQGIGTFKLDPSFSLPEHSDKKIIFPNDVITFEYDPKVTEDALLIDAIVQHTKKIKPLATSDLDSFLMAGKELLILNNPFTLNGIGSIVKTQNGDFKFVPPHFPKAKIPKPKSVTKNKPRSVLFKNHAFILSNKGKKNLIIIVVISAVSLTAWGLINIFMNKKKDKKLQEQTQKLPANHTATLKSIDTIKTRQLINTAKARDINNKYTFKIVFLETNNHEEALKKLNEITGFGHSPVMYKSGSVYKIAMPFSLPLTDTLHIKDSLDQFYSLGKGFVEIE